MRQMLRLLRYVGPYWPALVAAVLLMAISGLLDAVRLLLVGPMLDIVLQPQNPEAQAKAIHLIQLSGKTYAIDLHRFVPQHFHNPWTVVAFALVMATLLKGITLYAGTYLVNYAGFGMITDLRDALYNTILRRSMAFFHKYSTGTLLSTIINDVERIQYAMSTVLADFLQQFFILLFTAGVVIVIGWRAAWVLLIFVPF